MGGGYECACREDEGHRYAMRGKGAANSFAVWGRAKRPIFFACVGYLVGASRL